MKRQSTKNKEVTLKPVREKELIPSNGTIRQTSDFATEKKYRPENNACDMLREHYCQPIIT